jgi:capsular exopolysaccharide synthesis family protein
MNNQTFINLAPYWDIIHRHRVSFFCTLVAGCLITALAMVLLPKKYTSKVLLEIRNPEANTARSDQQSATADREMEWRLESLSQETVTATHLKKLIERYNLYPQNGKPGLGAARAMAGAITITIPDSVLHTKTPARWQKILPPDVIEVSFEYADPAKAEAATADLGKILTMEFHNDQERRLAGNIALLSGELDDARAKLAANAQKIKNLKEKFRGSLPQDLGDNVKVLQTLQLQLQRAQQASSQAASKSDQHALSTPKPGTPDAVLAALQNKLIALQARYSDRYPDVRQTRAEIASVEQEVKREQLVHPPVSRPAAKSPTAFLERQIDQYERRIAETPAHEEAMASVNRDYSILTRRYRDLSDRLFEVSAQQKIFERGQGDRLVVLQPADLPTQPSFPKPLAVIGGGIVATLLIALAIPFGAYYSDSSFKDSEEIKSELADVSAITISRYPEIFNGGPSDLVLGQHVSPELPPGQTNGAVQADANGAAATKNGTAGQSSNPPASDGNHNGSAQRFAPHYPAPPVISAGDRIVGTAADEFQLLAFKLKRWAAPRNAKIFVVASAVGGEGKSFVALNLAAALAASGSNVLLVDSDFRAPFQHYSLSVVPVLGLLGYLQGDADFETCIQPTPVAGLRLVAAGGICHRAPEHLVSHRMKEFLDTAKQSDLFRYVIVDTPPTLLVPDAQIMASVADATILVAAADITPRAAVARALSMLEPANLFSVVLNRFVPSYSKIRSERYGRYGRYGKYGKYGKYAQREELDE